MTSEKVTTKSGRVQTVRFYEAICPVCGKSIKRRAKHRAKYGNYCNSECRRAGMKQELGHDRWYFDAYNDSMRELIERSGDNFSSDPVMGTSGRRSRRSKKPTGS